MCRFQVSIWGKSYYRAKRHFQCLTWCWEHTPNSLNMDVHFQFIVAARATAVHPVTQGVVMRDGRGGPAAAHPRHPSWRSWKCVCVSGRGGSVLTWGALFLVCSVYWCPSVSLVARVADPVPPCCGMVGLALPLQGGRQHCDHRRLQVIDHEACVEQAQLYILCQVQRLLITLLLTLYHIGQCLTDRGICLCGIYLPLWHKSNMIL